MLIKLHYSKNKNHKSINNREAFVNADKIRFMQRRIVVADESLTEIWFNSKDCIIVTETSDEMNYMIEHNPQDKIIEDGIIFKDDFNEKECENFVKKEG